MYILVGLGNPGADYEQTRHNVGRIVLSAVHRAGDFSPWKKDGVLNALVSSGELSGKKIKLVMPETFMNKSGQSVAPLVTDEKKAEQLIVVYDDLDLPLGAMKISFNRSSGGHRGVESIIRSLKTEAFTRIRVGISPKTPTGKMKKPSGDVAVQDFILGVFRDAEMKELQKVTRQAVSAVEVLVSGGSSAKGIRMARETAMGEFNGK